MSSNYDVSSIEKCEYIESMRKVYFKDPKQENGKCEGYRNKYNSNYSNVCLKCNHLKRSDDV